MEGSRRLFGLPSSSSNGDDHCADHDILGNRWAPPSESDSNLNLHFHVSATMPPARSTTREDRDTTAQELRRIRDNELAVKRMAGHISCAECCRQVNGFNHTCLFSQKEKGSRYDAISRRVPNSSSYQLDTEQSVDTLQYMRSEGLSDHLPSK